MPLVQIDLQGHHYRGEPYSFRVEILDHALDHLIEDARNAYRVYELFAIRRPGDLWKYLWVRLIDVPGQVWESYRSAREQQRLRQYHLWPDPTLPLLDFDRLFSWGCDTTTIDECWLMARHGQQFKALAVEFYARITQAQAGLHDSQDSLIRNEIRSLLSVQHPCDYKAESPFVLTRDDYLSPVIQKRTAGYYEKLRQLLTLPQIRNVACCGDEDFQTIRWVCAAQRQRGEALGQRPVDGLAIHLLSDGFPAIEAWEAVVQFWGSGPPYGDLWVHQNPYAPCIKDYVERFKRRHWLYFVHEDNDEIAGYQRTAGEGWALYQDQNQNRNYDLTSQRQLERFIRHYEEFPHCP